MTDEQEVEVSKKLAAYEQLIGDMVRSATAGLCSFEPSNWYHFLKEVRKQAEAGGFDILGYPKNPE